ncbi:endo alpha-1,4 polygalactosaminidase [bacterium]|nr:endo alpha-1,4 polygalactosaminidase [bacterium]
MSKKNCLLIVFVVILTVCVLTATLLYLQKEETSYWIPQVGDSFQWQLSGSPIDTTIEVDIYDIDLFETPQEVIDNLHTNDKKVICYINVGAWEQFRNDSDQFKEEILGNNCEGWEGERWLDISRYEIFSDILEQRFDLAKEKGCDAIEPDNIQGYQEETGFDLTYEDQLTYNIWLAHQAHSRGMSIGLKNNPDQVGDLVEHYDWALLEDCHVWEFCEEFKPFIQEGKAVFQVEYVDSEIGLNDFCSESVSNNYFGILKNRELDSWVEFCN